jgi:two-component sensor histidine kinase
MLLIKDNGPGFPAAVQSGDTRRFGIKLIESLADKLKALVRFENENGAAVYITIPYKNHKQ